MDPKPRLLMILDGDHGCHASGCYAMVFFFAPVEAVMGQVQKVFYFHVSAGWVGMLGIFGRRDLRDFLLENQQPHWDIVEWQLLR